ncbi:hypothetical protein CLIB1423_14S01310 [[Candida] railenensis]|uniref:Uncharacterized protein n=1 Tax=[Candida] railenensis TaxID=45579 RepID=A0A9P0QSQ8_9ASCO|nr:hypothetical protein CLIB1423_14S01310 [[Candida] railenensis]
MSEGNTPSEDRLEPYISADLPEYIVKNLTPLKKKEKRLRRNSDESNKQLERKRGFLESKRSKLQERSNLILQKVREVELRRQLFSRSLRNNLNRNLELASERRKAAIEARKTNARRYSALFGYENSNFQLQKKKIADPCNVEVSESTVLLDFKDQESQIISQPTVDQKASSVKDIDPPPLKQVLVIQKAIRRRLLISKVKQLRDSNLLFIISRRSSDNLKKLLSPNMSSFSKIYEVLELFKLPGSYRSFIYSLILMAEFRDSISESVPHPGYNTNLYKEEENDKEDKFARMISIIVYKASYILSKAFIKLIHRSDWDSLLSPYSIERLKFAHVWKQFHFYFDIFRPNHLRRTIKSSSIAIEIFDSKIASFVDGIEDESVLSTVKEDRDWLEGKRNKLIQKLNYLYDEAEVHEVVSPWTQAAPGIIGYDEIRQSISSAIENCSQRPSSLDLSATQQALAELNLNLVNKKALPSGLRYPNTHIIKVNNRTYYFPPFITINQWSKYIVEKHLNRPIDKLETYGIPKVLKTGFISKKSSSQFVAENHPLHIEDVFKFFNLETIFDKVSNFINGIEGREAEENISKLDDFLTNAFLNIFEYCMQFHDLLKSNSYEVITSLLTKVRLFRCMPSLRQTLARGRSVIRFFELHFMSLSSLANVAPPSLGFLPSRCTDFLDLLKLLQDDSQFTNEHMIDIVLFYQGTDIIIHDLWLRRCYSSYENDISGFASAMCLASSYYGPQVYHVNRSTNSPHLRYPKFYEFMYQNDSTFGTKIGSNFVALYKASNSIPSLEVNMGQSSNVNSSEYFQKIFASFLVSDNKYSIASSMSKKSCENELTKLFIQELKSLIIESRSVLISGIVLAIVGQVYSQVQVVGNACNRSTLNHYMKGVGEKLFKYVKLCLEKESCSLQMSEIFQLITSTILANLQDYIEADSSSIEFHEKFLVTYLAKVIGTASTGSSVVARTLREKLVKVLSERSEPTRLIRGNFIHLYNETLNLKKSYEAFFKGFYGLYFPILNWIYEDIGTPVI